MQTSAFKRLGWQDKTFHGFNILLLLLITVIVLYPLLFVISASFNEGISTMTSLSLWPKNPGIAGYQAVFEYEPVWTGYKNSLIYMALGTCVNMFFTVCAAYPLSRKDLFGRGFFMGLFVFTMYFSGGLIPGYLLVRDLGLLDSIWALFIPGAMSVYQMIIMRTYFATQIPGELREAASIDGCGSIRFLIKMALPLSKPVLAVIALQYAVGHWNSYFGAMIYLSSASKMPLQVILRDILVLNTMDSASASTMSPEAIALLARRRELMKYALIIVSSLPVMMLYPFVQKYFVKGVMIGAVKG